MSALIERLAREAIEKAAIWSDGPPGNRDRYIPPAHPKTLEAIAAALREFQAEAARVACTGCYQPMFYGHGKPDCPVPKIEAL